MSIPISWSTTDQTTTFTLKVAREIVVNDHCVRVTPMEYQVFFYLLWHAPRVRPAAVIYEDINGVKPQNDASIRVHLARVKMKVATINSSAAELIQSVWGRGPRLSEAPPYPYQYWSQDRKLFILNSLESGTMTLETLCRMYPDLSRDEIAYWKFRRELAGDSGLKFSRSLYPRPRRRWVG